jgi:copper(I)-binding protein
MRKLAGTFVVALWLLTGPVAAAEPGGASVQVVEPWARATAATAKTGAAYMILRNTGAAGDRLVAASTPVAGRVELHTHVKDGDVMRMRKVEAIDVDAHGSAKLEPGGLHVMFFDIKAPLKEGQKFPLTLKFEKAGEIATEVAVRSAGAASSSGHMEHSEGGHAGALSADTRADQAAIRDLMRGAFDRPEAPLAVEPIVVQDDVAVAGWAQAETGGRALLRKTHGKWMLVLCSGDALKDSAALGQMGIAPAAAATLAKAVVAAERSLPPARLAMFSRFEGIVRMDESGDHPPGHGGHGTGAHGSGAHDQPAKH